MTDIFKSADWAREALAKEEAGGQSIVMRPSMSFFASIPAGYTPRALRLFGDYLCVATDEGPLFYDSAGNRVEIPDPLPEETYTVDVLMGERTVRLG